MSSNLEIVIIHLPDNIGDKYEESPKFIDNMKYVKSQTDCRSVRWGRALNNSNVSFCFFEWASLDANHEWQKQPHYKEFREFWFAFAKTPAAGIPALEMRHFTIPSEELQEIVAKKVVKIVIGGSGKEGKFTAKVVEGFGEGQSISLTGLDNENEGTKTSGGGGEAVYTVRLTST